MKRVALVAFAILGVFVSTGCGASGDPGKIGVVRNGGPFDNTNIRQIMPVGAGYTWVGLNSTVHFYPASNTQRIYNISTDPNQTEAGGAEQVCVPTSDGVNVCIEAAIYFNTAFDNSAQGQELAKEFELAYGVRSYPDVTHPGNFVHAYDGDVGWSSFLNTIVRPVIDNELRQAIGQVQCRELVASCALVQGAGKVSVKDLQSATTQTNISQVQESVNAGLQADIDSTLKKPYLTNINFRLSRVKLPPNVQTAIDDAQAAFAKVAESQAQVGQAQQQNLANELRAKTYSRCPACAQIDEIKALQGLKGTGVTVFFGVNPTGVNVK